MVKRKSAGKPEPGSQEFLRVVKRHLVYGSAVGRLWFVGGIDTQAGVAPGDDLIPINVNGRKYDPAKLCWLLQYEVWPECDIGVRNGIKSDLRLENLFAIQEDRTISVIKAGTDFVLMSDGEQVMVSSVIGDVMWMATRILCGGGTGVSDDSK